MARVTSAKANDEYAHLNPNGLYWVKFDADRDDKSQEHQSMLVRLVKHGCEVETEVAGVRLERRDGD